ncbi:MAG TPA: PAS domain-containing protein, partial [Tepidisphaeraceae bacterium]|nr:PAS domain-containing protein [Tepidisphaeraceae bacterium]
MAPDDGELGALDFRAIFDAVPGPHLILRPDQRFSIVAANDAYLQATRTTREGLIGRGIFEAFPDNPDYPTATGVSALRASLARVIAHRQAHTMAVQKYDIPHPDGGFEERYWSPVNTPVLGPSGEVQHIVHRVEDVTEFVRLKARDEEQERRVEELRGHAERSEAEVFLRSSELTMANARLRRQIDEREQAEGALVREQEFLRAVLDNAADGIVACDGEGVLRFFNGAARAFHGLPEQPLPPERWAEHYDLYLPDGKTRMAKEQVPLFRALSEGTVKDVEMVIAAKGQPPRLLTANGRAIRDASGQKLGAVVVMHDLTARKVAEEQRERALREEAARKGADAFAQQRAESEARLRLVTARLGAVIEQAPAFICTLRGPEHVFELANERYYDIVGRRDIIGKAVREALPEVEGQGFFELLDDVYRTGKTFSGDEMPVVLRRTDEDTLDRRFVNLVYQALREADGSVSGIFVHGVDVTDVVLAREALRASEARSRQLVETAHEGIWTIDADGRTTYVNQRMAELLGYAPEEMMGRVHTDFMWEQDRPYGDVEMERRREGTAAVWDQRYRRKDGGELWTVASCSALYDAEGKFAGALGMFTDITRRKRAEAERQALLDSERAARAEAEKARSEAERANEAKDRFLAVLSHELRTPLSPVVMTIAELERHPDLPDDVREAMSMIRRNIDLETRLIDDLLDLSRVTSGKLRLRMEQTNLHDILRHAYEVSASDMNAKRLKIKFDFTATNDRVTGDPSRLQQVFWNLMKNAIKFSPEGRDITVRTSDAGQGRVRVDVADEGMGITPQALPHIFGAFEQGDARTTHRFGGLGLGLAISRAVMDMHGGTITATSAGAGKGATFTVEMDTTALAPTPAATDG